MWVDEAAEEITILQSKWFVEPATLSASQLQEWIVGARLISTEPILDRALTKSPSQEVESLFDRESISDRLNSGYGFRNVLVTNAALRAGARSLIDSQSAHETPLEVWDLDALALYVRYSDRALYVHEKRTLEFEPSAVFRIDHAESAPVLFGALSAAQIAALPGIENKTLFAQNVRLDLGRTRVNKDLAATVRDRDEHARFMAFHNGLTILCQAIEQEPSRPERVTIRDFSVVNGCQSALAFFREQHRLTADLLVPVRLVQVSKTPSLAEDITYRSNNQNAISVKDLRANDSTQIQIQAEFQHLFGPQIGYQIKRGEVVQADTVIPNDLAAQILLALYVGEPWQAHRKSALFAERYKQIFRPGVGAPNIYLGYVVWEEVQRRRTDIETDLIAGYALTVFVLIYLAGRIMREAPLGAALLENPLSYLRHELPGIRGAVSQLVADIIIDFDGYIRDESEVGYFDYKSRFKSQTAIRHLTEDVLRSYKRAVSRNPSQAFSLS